MSLILKEIALAVLQFAGDAINAWLDKLKAEKAGQQEQQKKQDDADADAIKKANQASNDAIAKRNGGGVPSGQAGQTIDPDQRD